MEFTAYTAVYIHIQERREGMNWLTITKFIAGAGIGLGIGNLAENLAGRLLAKRNIESEGPKYSWIPLAAAAAVCAAAALVIPTDWNLVYVYINVFLLLTLSITDIRCRIIPNDIVLGIFAAKLIFSVPAMLGLNGFPQVDLKSSLIGMAGFFILYMLPALFGGAVGFGDVKLAAALGFTLGLGSSLICVCLMGLPFLAYIIVRRMLAPCPAEAKLGEILRTRLPMGPVFAACAAAVLITGYAVPLSTLTGMAI